MATGELAVMDKTGDTKTIWDTNNPDEVEAARKTFNDLKAKGYIAYNVNEDGKAGSVMRNFDPRAGKVIMTPPMRGG